MKFILVAIIGVLAGNVALYTLPVYARPIPQGHSQGPGAHPTPGAHDTTRDDQIQAKINQIQAKIDLEEAAPPSKLQLRVLARLEARKAQLESKLP